MIEPIPPVCDVRVGATKDLAWVNEPLKLNRLAELYDTAKRVFRAESASIELKKFLSANVETVTEEFDSD